MGDSFAVRLVRARRLARAASLQALRRPLSLRVLPNELRLSIAAIAAQEAPAGMPTTALLSLFAAPTPARCSRASVWLSVRAAQVKSVRVKKRLLRVALHDDQALTLCMQNAAEALAAATVMMHQWGVEPLVETNEETNETRAALTLDQLTGLFLESQHFRSLVHQMHAQIESLTTEVNEEEDIDAAVCLQSSAASVTRPQLL